MKQLAGAREDNQQGAHTHTTWCLHSRPTAGCGHYQRLLINKVSSHGSCSCSSRGPNTSTASGVTGMGQLMACQLHVQMQQKCPEVRCHLVVVREMTASSLSAFHLIHLTARVCFRDQQGYLAGRQVLLWLLLQWRKKKKKHFPLFSPGITNVLKKHVSLDAFWFFWSNTCLTKYGNTVW